MIRALELPMGLWAPGRQSAWVRSSLPAAMTVATQALNSLSNLAITWYLVRAIGVRGFGYYSTYFIISINVMTIWGACIGSPLNSVASKLSNRRRAEFVQAANFGQFLLVVSALVLGALAFIAADAAGLKSGDVLAVCVLTISMSMNDFSRRVRFFNNEMSNLFAFDVVRYALLALSLSGLRNLAVAPGAIAYTLAIAASYVLPIPSFALVCYRRSTVPFSLKRNLAHLRRLLRSGRWVAAVAFLKFVDGGAVLFIAFVALGPYEAGLIRLAQTIVGLTMPAIQSLEHIVPKMIGENIRKLGFEPAMKWYSKVALAIIVGFGLLYGVITAASPLMLRAMNVDDDGFAVGLIAGFSMIYLLRTILQTIEFRLRAQERAEIASKATVVSAVLALILVYPSVVFFGSIGAIACIVAAKAASVAVAIWLTTVTERRLGVIGFRLQ